MSLLVLNMKLHIKHLDQFMVPYMEARKRMLFHIVLKKSQNQDKKVNNTLVCFCERNALNNDRIHLAAGTYQTVACKIGRGHSCFEL